LKPASLYSLSSILSRSRERRQSIRCAIFLFPAAFFSPLALAADAARPAYVPPPAAAMSSGSVLQVVLSLLLVLAAVVVVGWILKRINLPQQGAGNALKVISGAVGRDVSCCEVTTPGWWRCTWTGECTAHHAQGPCPRRRARLPSMTTNSRAG
jgi:hypothetical protein